MTGNIDRNMKYSLGFIQKVSSLGRGKLCQKANKNKQGEGSNAYER